MIEPRHLKLALSMAAVLAAIALLVGDPFLMVFLSPGVAGAVALLIVAFLFWLFGPARRGYLYGTGFQQRWGYQGHDVRGDLDPDGQLWISLHDCQLASGLALEKRAGRLCPQHKREDSVKGLLISREGMDRIFDGLRGDVSQINRLRLFLDREVWKVRRG